MSSISRIVRLERRLLVRCRFTRPLAPRTAERFVSTSSVSHGVTPSVFLPSSSLHETRYSHCTHQLTRTFSVDITESVESLQQAILDHVEQGDVVTADQALVRLEKVAKQEQKEINLDTYTSVMDVWVKYQQQVEEGPHRVNEEFQAADRAHSILERLQRRLELEGKDAVLRPTQHHYDVVLNAWLTVTRTMWRLDTPLRGIPQRAQRILEQMQQQSETDDTIQPCIHHYNAVMETWGNSPEHLRGTMAENLFQKLSFEMEPDNETYLTLIRAWCRSKQERAAFAATGHLMKMHRMLHKDSEAVKLTMEDYKTILEAWTRAGDKLAAQKAFWVIKLMQKAYMDRVSDVRPDQECYRYVLATYARSTLPNLGADVDKVIAQMEDRLLTPDSECYTYAIRTWKNCASHFLNKGTQHDDATHAARLLTEMEKDSQRSSDVVVQPTTENFNDVIQAWSTSTKAAAAIHAESLLKKMEKLYAEGDVNLKPDADSYRWALEAWANSPSRDKLNHAVTVLSRMKDLTEGSEDDHAEPNVDVFNAFIHVCGATPQMKAADRRYNLKLAVNTVEEMRNRGKSPNSTTFCLLLEACQNLLPMGKERSRAAENIFKNCCDLGLVDDEVLAQFRAVVPDELFTDLVVANTTEDAADGTKSSKMVPGSWTRNVGIKVKTDSGKKPKPLNIDSMFVVTKRVKEFRVKRLRQHKNKRLLRAGRNLYVQNTRMAKSP